MIKSLCLLFVFLTVTGAVNANSAEIFKCLSQSSGSFEYRDTPCLNLQNMKETVRNEYDKPPFIMPNTLALDAQSKLEKKEIAKQVRLAISQKKKAEKEAIKLKKQQHLQDLKAKKEDEKLQKLAQKEYVKAQKDKLKAERHAMRCQALQQAFLSTQQKLRGGCTLKHCLSLKEKLMGLEIKLSHVCASL